MAKKKRSGVKVNRGMWGVPTSVRIGQRGKGSINISKKGIRINPGCALLVLVFLIPGAAAASVIVDLLT